jgi:hypothetical protein
MRLRIGLAAAFLMAADLCPAARLSPTTEHAFEDYVARFEAQLAKRHACPATYLAVLDLPPQEQAAAERQLRSGALIMEPVQGGTWTVSGGLLHHWRAAAFVPHATAQQMLAVLRDYNHLSTYYAPQVESSRALRDQGQFAEVVVRLRERNVVTVVLDAEYAVETGLIGTAGGYGFSRSKHIWQVDQPGTAQERRLPEGQDDGFLWRLNSYWSFLQVPDGLLLECEAISLTRDVPPGLGWLVMPAIKDLPRASLAFTLNATKNALAGNAPKEAR